MIVDVGVLHSGPVNAANDTQPEPATPNPAGWALAALDVFERPRQRRSMAGDVDNEFIAEARAIAEFLIGDQTLDGT